MPVPKRSVPTRTAPTPRPGPAEEAEEPIEERGGNATPQSRASAFDDTTPETGLNIPVGNYTAYLVGAIKEVDGKKEGVKFTYEIYDGELQGKEVPTWYNFFDKDGNKMRGVGFFKRDMATLGQPDPAYDELENALQNLENERPLCNITVKSKDGYTNVYLQGLADGV